MCAYFHNPVSSRLLLLGALVVSAVLPDSRASEPTAELLDLAGRIEYGYYTQETRAIDTARSRLDRLPGGGELTDYYGALGAYRAAQLRASGDGRGLGRLVSECMERGRAAAAADQKLAGEAWVLVAACAVLGLRYEPGKARTYQNGLEDALAEALAADPENPRILVVAAWAISQRPAHEEPELRETVRDRLERALELFAMWKTPFGYPDWGEAEALAHLGEIHLELGDRRAARDYIEQSLLVAPDYRFALALQQRVLSR